LFASTTVTDFSEHPALVLTIGLTARQRILEIQAVEAQGQRCPSIQRFQADVVDKMMGRE
jgi:hypothetical protein